MNGFAVVVQNVKKYLPIIDYMEIVMSAPTVSEYYKLNPSKPYKTSRGTKHKYVQNGRSYDSKGFRMCDTNEELVLSRRSQQPFTTLKVINQAILRKGIPLEEVDIVPYKDGYAFIKRKDK